MKDVKKDQRYDPIQEIFHASIPQKQADPPDKRNNIEKNKRIADNHTYTTN